MKIKQVTREDGTTVVYAERIINGRKAIQVERRSLEGVSHQEALVMIVDAARQAAQRAKFKQVDTGKQGSAD